MMAFVDNYLALRRAAGYKLVAVEGRLRSFARFAEARGESHIRTDTAVAWAAEALSPRQRHVRLRDVAVLARHLRAEDPVHEVPDPRVFPRQPDVREPYIYSDDEVARILTAASRLRPVGSSRPDTHRTLFGLLAATGMRVGEALRLRLADHTGDTLRIQRTKFRKSRLVVLHPTVAAVLANYRVQWRGVATEDGPFFVSTRGTALGPDGVFSTFDKILRSEGMRTDTRTGRRERPSPALRDFRHTFAVRSLERCPRTRPEIDRHMLALATYMGHVSVAGTYWYLNATPRLMRAVADACEAWRRGGIQ